MKADVSWFKVRQSRLQEKAPRKIKLPLTVIKLGYKQPLISTHLTTEVQNSPGEDCQD